MADTYNNKFIQLKDSTGNLYPIIDITNFAAGGVRQTGTLATQDWTTATISSAIAASVHLTREVVPSLKDVTDPKTTVIYMVPLGTTGEAQNIYEEYLYVSQPDAIALADSASAGGYALRDASLNKTVGGTTYYAWKADTGVFYTTTELPSNGDALYTIADDGDISQEATGVASYTSAYEGFELLGTTQVDISGKQDKLTAGDNIQITAGTATDGTKTTVISAKDTTYKAGANININSGTISVADASSTAKGVVQIGTNISVSSGTISVADASSTAKGVVQLSEDTLGDRSTVAATEKAVKTYVQETITGGTVTFNIQPATKTTIGGVIIGDNISVTTDGTISATDTTYTAGEGLTLTDTEFSLMAAVKLDPGATDYTTATIPDVGGIIVGEHLSLGEVSVPDKSDGANEGDTIRIQNVLSVDEATNDTMGVVTAGTGVSITGGTLSTLLQYDLIPDTPDTPVTE